MFSPQARHAYRARTGCANPKAALPLALEASLRPPRNFLSFYFCTSCSGPLPGIPTPRWPRKMSSALPELSVHSSHSQAPNETPLRQRNYLAWWSQSIHLTASRARGVRNQDVVCIPAASCLQPGRLQRACKSFVMVRRG